MNGLSAPVVQILVAHEQWRAAIAELAFGQLIPHTQNPPERDRAAASPAGGVTRHPRDGQLDTSGAQWHALALQPSVSTKPRFHKMYR